MRCEVLLFAQVREAVGRERLAIDLPDGATVSDAIERLTRDYPAIGPLRDRIAVAVNQHYQGAGALLRDGDEIALIPPVSGG
jgi:molybdopterin converting factor subunit 1